MTTESNLNELNTTVDTNSKETEETTPTKKGRKRNGYKQWKERVANRGFKLIDKRFKQREEILPGVITQAAPISGEVRCEVWFETSIFYRSMKMALERWSLSVGYQELRSLKGLNGLGSSISDERCVEYTAKVLTICAYCMINAPNVDKNFGVYLMNLGLGRLVLPSLYMDLLHLGANMNAYHQPKFLETASLLFKTIKLTQKVENEKEFKEEFKDVQDKFGQWSIPFLKAYNYLSRFTQLTNIMSTSESDIFALTTTTSPHFFNVINYDMESKTRELMLGRGATAKDVLIGLLLSCKIASSDLKPYHMDGFVYLIPYEKVITGVKRALLQEYFGIEDTFVSPTTTACSEGYSKAVNQNITSI